MGFFKNIISSFSRMGKSVFSFNKDKSEISFSIKDDERYIYNLHEFKKKSRHDSSVIDAYTLKTEDIFIEYINLDSFSSWNGLSRGYFEDLLKNKLKITLDLQERVDIKNYEFSTYKVNSSFIIHLIYIYEGSTDVFILDTKGKLFKELLKSLDNSFEYKYDEYEKGSVNFEISLVKENFLKHYFNSSD